MRDVESDAEEIYRAAGCDPRAPQGTGWLAARLLGRDCIRYRRFMRTPAQLARVHEDWRIYLRDGVSDETFLIGHELAELFYRRTLGAADEETCDALAAALVAPRPAVIAAWAGLASIPRLARAFRSTHSWAFLRVAEATGRPTALVAPKKVRTRGNAQWPDDVGVRALAALPRAPGLKKTRLRDDPARVALIAV